jgi:ceramide glucosyltransferase
MIAVTAGLVLFGVLAAAVMAWSQRRLILAPPPPVPDELPPISVLKPLKGVDAELEENLESVFAQDYPKFEVILGTEDADDPALDVARRVAARHPEVPSIVLSDPSRIGFNPKVNNLSNLARHARHATLLISDSNIRVDRGYLSDLAAQRAKTGAGLVWSLFRGVGGRGLGGRLEELQLNLYVAGGMAALVDLAGRPGCVGKSMLLSREDLEAVGGFPFLARFLAEDQVCAEELHARGRRVVVTGHVVDNILGRRDLRDFASRHLRWARLRRRLSLAAYAGEFLLNPVFGALLSALALRGTEAWLLAGAALAAMSAIDALAERGLGRRRPLAVYPALELALALVRGALWFVPLFSSTVVWRHNVLRLGPRSEIQPVLEPIAEEQRVA